MRKKQSLGIKNNQKLVYRDAIVKLHCNRFEAAVATKSSKILHCIKCGNTQMMYVLIFFSTYIIYIFLL